MLQTAPIRLLTLLAFVATGFGLSDARAAANAAAPASQSCVQVFYDAPAGVAHPLGQTQAIFLSNLIGHFPQFSVQVRPIETYRRGQIENCRASLYLGTYFNNRIPKSFLEDFTHTRKNVAWMRYSIWQLGSQFEKLFGFRHHGVAGLDRARLDSQGRPTFFKDIHYKGEVFQKYGEFRSVSSSEFMSDHDMILLKPGKQAGSKKIENSSQILAEAVHNGTQEKTPYILRNGNHFYFADSPFSFIHEADRYLVFSDVLFDILGASPAYPGKKPAVIRIEDISSGSPDATLRKTAEILHEKQVPFLVSLIPIFTDPLKATSVRLEKSKTPISDDARFLSTLREIKSLGGEFAWHGVTHQHAEAKNPWNAVSGFDFEFWDALKNSPLPEDSPQYVLSLMDRGWGALSSAGIFPSIWEVPHYRASALDYHLFAQLSPWSIGRVLYSPQKVTGSLAWADPRVRNPLAYATTGFAGHHQRHTALKNLDTQPLSPLDGQFFPFEIYGDFYGQRVLPENLGFLSDTRLLGDASPRTADEIITIVRRNRVLRDQWASLYLHLSYLEKNPKDRYQELARIVEAIRECGYEFINPEQFAVAQKGRLRATPLFDFHATDPSKSNVSGKSL